MKQPGLIFCILFFSLVSLKVTAQMERNRAEDSLLQLLRVAKADTLRMDLYNKLRRATYYSDPPSSEKYTAEYLNLAIQIGDSLQIAIANFYMGNANVVNGNPDKALPFYLKAANYFESKEDELSRLSSTYNGIASAYENNISDSLSLVYFEKSYETSKRANDHRRMGIALVNRSNIHSKNGELSKAIQLLEEAVRLLQDPNSAIYLKPAKINLAAAYAENNQLEKAESIYEGLLVEIDSSKDVLNYAMTLSNYGRLFQKKDNDEKALEYLNRAYFLFHSNGFMKERYNMMPSLIDAKYNVNKHREAILLFYDYNLIKDSIFSIEKDKNLTEALQKFESEKKDKALLEQQLQIEKKNRQKNFILYGLIATAVFLIVLIAFFRKRLQYQKTIAIQKEDIQKQKITELTQKNKLLAMSSMIEGQEAERLRIAKDLHDSLGGLLSNVKAHFTIIQNEIEQLEKLNITERTNHLIDEACLEVRRISHNMMPHALSISGLDGALEDIADYMRSLKYEVTLDMHHLPDDMESTKQITIFRLIQEILSNIRKHAEAKSVLIQLFRHDNSIHLIIEDDGKGFNYEEAISSGGLGLKNINSRVEFLDGKIEWDSVPERGTTITINIPV
jgi:two-component system NarL family sensor kinase